MHALLALTQAMRMFSVAMKGSSDMTLALTTPGQTCIPSAMFVSRVTITSAVKKPSGRYICWWFVRYATRREKTCPVVGLSKRQARGGRCFLVVTSKEIKRKRHFRGG